MKQPSEQSLWEASERLIVNEYDSDEIVVIDGKSYCRSLDQLFVARAYRALVRPKPIAQEQASDGEAFKSRSVMRREAAQRGEEPPEFEQRRVDQEASGG